MESPWLPPLWKIPIMIKAFPIALFAFLLGCLPLAANPQDFQYGPRPADSIFDPNNVLDPTTKKELIAPLHDIYQKDGVDVIVVILPDLDDAPPEHVAKSFASAWCGTQIHAVVLHVPGREDSPWIVPAGGLINQVKPEVLHKDVADARRRAASEPNDSAKVRAAVTETTDKLRFWLATAINRSDYLITERSKVQAELDHKARQWRIAMLTMAASAIPVLCGLSALIYFLRKPGPRRFPTTQPPRRLGAPHAGGNHAVGDIGLPLS